MGADGPLVTIWPVWHYVWLIPAGRGRPAPTHLCPIKMPGSRGGYGGRNRESQAGSSRACQLPRAPQYLSACFGYAILESIIGTENLVQDSPSSRLPEE
jgi:hypothetical protein